MWLKETISKCGRKEIKEGEFEGMSLEEVDGESLVIANGLSKGHRQ